MQLSKAPFIVMPLRLYILCSLVIILYYLQRAKVAANGATFLHS